MRRSDNQTSGRFPAKGSYISLSLYIAQWLPQPAQDPFRWTLSTRIDFLRPLQQKPRIDFPKSHSSIVNKAQAAWTIFARHKDPDVKGSRTIVTVTVTVRISFTGQKIRRSEVVFFTTAQGRLDPSKVILTTRGTFDSMSALEFS